MRLAVLADVHGNLPALEAVLADVERQGVDGMVVAGDLTTGGPQPVEVMHLLRERGSWLIRGNVDDYLLAYHAGTAPWRNSRNWATTRWAYEHLDRKTFAYLASLPQQRVIALPGAAPIRVVHGSPRRPAEGLCPDRDPAKLAIFRRAYFLKPDYQPGPLALALAGVAEPVLVCGHTHIPWQQRCDGRLVLNPGSVGGPIDGDARAQYALLTWHGGRCEAEHRALPYDHARLRAAYEESGLLAEGGGFARAVLQGIETGQNVAGFLVAHAFRLARQAGYGDCQVLPDDIWDEAVATFDWGRGCAPDSLAPGRELA